jgi:hypothetical protein
MDGSVVQYGFLPDSEKLYRTRLRLVRYNFSLSVKNPYRTPIHYLHSIAHGSYRVVSYCASGRTVLTLSSDRVALSRIVSRFHSRGSCSDRILIFPRLYHDFSSAILLYETYGTICRRHDMIRGA